MAAAPLSIRPATPADAALIFRFIRDLAEYERLSHAVEASEVDVARDLFGVQQVVRIQPLDVRALGELQRLVARCCGPHVRLRHDLDAATLKPPADRHGPVARAVVDNDDLDPRPGLGHGRLDRVGDPALRVIRGDQNRD